MKSSSMLFGQFMLVTIIIASSFLRSQAQTSCCIDGFKPQKITMRYTGESCSATNTSQPTDKYNCSGDPANDALVYIIANDNASAGSGKIWFSGEVALDSTFLLNSTLEGDSKLPSNTVVHVFDSENGTEIQTVNFHTSCSQPLTIGDQWGAIELVGMISESGATCGEDPPSDISCCVDGFKPQNITFKYTGESCSATSTSQSSDKYSCSGDPSGDAQVYIVSNDNSSPSSGKIWFSGSVSINQLFTIDATNAGSSRLPSNTYIHIYNQENGTIIQTVNFHTSCSQPLDVGDQWGASKLISMVSENGATCGSSEKDSLVNIINGYTFYDLNQSAIFDLGEPVIPTMSVSLYADNNCDGQVDGGDDSLDMAVTDGNGFYQFTRNWGGGPYNQEYALTSKYHDGEEKSDGSIDLGHADLHLGDRIIGLFYEDINIPNGPTISSAYLEFTSYNNESGTVEVRINAESADNGTTLGGSTNNFSSRTKTTAKVDWNLGAWSSDQVYTSPDISSIIQELVDRVGWSAMNDITLFVNPLSGSAKRKAISQDRSSINSPRLIINYDISGYKECYVTHVDTTTEPNNNTLTTVHTEEAVFTSGGNTDSMNNFGFYGELPEGSNLITGTVFADEDEDGLNDAGEFGIDSIEVNLYKDMNCDQMWDASDIWLRKTTTNAIGFYQFAVDYEPLTTSSTFNISSKNDDSEEHSKGKNDLSHGDLHLNERTIAMRYLNVTIPAGAVIQTATLEFVSANDENDAAQVRIYGEDVNSSGSLTSTNYDLTSRTTTTANRNWSLTPWIKNQLYTSPDFADVVQEIIDRGGWSSGNNLSIIIKSVNGSGKRKATSQDGDASESPKLTVTYSLHGVNDCYITKIGKKWPNIYEYLTTDSINDQVFTDVDQVDSLNDFGLWGSAVPVELISLKANWDYNNGIVTWITASEENNSHFVVERSFDGQIFESIGEVASGSSNGYSTSLLYYSFEDIDLRNRVKAAVFFRLKQFDYNGDFEYSPWVALTNDVDITKSFTIYPNPSTGTVYINIDEKNIGLTHISVIDVTGKMVYKQTVEASNSEYSPMLNLGEIDRGIYYLHVTKGKMDSTKILVIDRK